MTDDLIARAEAAYVVRLLPNGARDELLGDLIAALRDEKARADAAGAKLAEAVEALKKIADVHTEFRGHIARATLAKIETRDE